MRDAKDDYRRALVEEYESYQRAGRTAEAEHVAQMLTKHYGVEVTPRTSEKDEKDEQPKPEADDELERADKERPPEDTAKPIAKRGPGRPRKPSQGSQG